MCCVSCADYPSPWPCISHGLQPCIPWCIYPWQRQLSCSLPVHVLFTKACVMVIVVVTSCATLQAVGIPPNVASAEALLQASKSCTHLSDRVNQLIAPFQPALAAAQLTQLVPSLPDFSSTSPVVAAAQSLLDRFPIGSTGAAQNILVGQAAALPTSSTRGQAGSEGQAPSGMRSLDQSSGAGPSVAKPQKGLLPAGLEASSEKPSESVLAAPEKETLERAPGSGPPTAAPVTPVAHSESAEASSTCSE